MHNFDSQVEVIPEARQWQDTLRRFYDTAVRRPRRLPYAGRRLVRRLSVLIEPGRRILDLGCSSGDLLAALRPGYGCGIDFDARAIEHARTRYPHLDWRCGAIEDELPGLGKPFDFIILNHVIEEVYDLQAVLRALHPLWGADTRLLLAHPNRLWRPLRRIAARVGLRSRVPLENGVSWEDVQNLLCLEGFEVIQSLGTTILPLWLPLLSEAVNRFLGNLPALHHLALSHLVVARKLRPPDPEARPGVTVVVPARNEAGNIAALLDRLPALADRQELIFVEGHSTDDTWPVIQQAAAAYRGPWEVRAVQQDGRGKGDAVRKGFDLARHEILLILDADLSVPPEELPRFVRALVEGRGELINGSRMVYPMERGAMRFLNYLGNQAFALLLTHLLGQRVRDALCGTKVLRSRHYQRIAAGRAYFGDADPFGDFDLLFGAARLSLRIVDVPVHYRARTYGATNIAPFRNGLRLLRQCGTAARKLRYL